MKSNSLAKSVFLLALTIVFGISGTSVAAEYRGQARLGIGYTDNIGRAADQEVDETMVTVGFDFGVTKQSRRLDLSLDSSFNYLDYQDATYDAEWVGGLRGKAAFVLIDERVRWIIEDNFGQQLADTFQPARPNNREDVNYFSTGPAISLLPASRNSIDLNARFDRVDYEDRPADNDRLSGTLSFEREIGRDSSMSLNIDGRRVEYDETALAPPYESHAAYIGYSAKGKRTSLSIDVGFNELEYAGNESDGLLLGLNWTRDISANGQLTIAAGSRYSDQGDLFRSLQRTEPQLDDTADLENLAAPFQNNSLSFAYSLQRVRYSVNVSIGANQQDYKGGSDRDRDNFGGSLNVRREMTPKVFVGAVADLDRREYKYADRRDDDLRLGLNGGYHIGSGFDVILDYQHYQRNSTAPGADYKENRVLVRLAYTPRWSR